MITEDKLSNLLGHTKTIIDHQREMKKARGENFNVFSILKMERRENGTHSAFLTELLNPKGSHYKDDVFLSLFLEILDAQHLDVKSARVQPEHPIGAKDISIKTGGRIDIYICDDYGNCLSIENKIDAGDQEAQIERYCNYKKGNNRVYYLTLFGAEPSVASKGNLENGKDFFTISYRDHILKWLGKCIKEAAEQPILRESIKQYKLLIQKLTATMAEADQQKLTDLMLHYFEEAEYIAANFTRVSTAIKEQVRQDVIIELKERLSGEFSVVTGNSADTRNSNFWIKPSGLENSPMYFGVEGFSGLGHFGGALFIGVFNTDGVKTRAEQYADRFSDWWVKNQILKDPDQQEIKLHNPETLQRLSSDKSLRDNLIHHIANEIELYLQKETGPLYQFLQSAN